MVGSVNLLLSLSRTFGLSMQVAVLTKKLNGINSVPGPEPISRTSFENVPIKGGGG